MRSSLQSKRLLKGIKIEEAICDTWETHCAEQCSAYDFSKNVNSFNN